MSRKYPVPTKERINPSLNYADGEMVRIIELGKIPYIEVGIFDPQKAAQKRKYHAQIGDIYEQATIKQLGRRIVMKEYGYDKCKAMLFVWYANECELNGEPLKNPPRYFTCPLTGQQITERSSTTDMSVTEAAGFIEFLNAIGADCGVVWSDPKLKQYDNYREAQE